MTKKKKKKRRRKFEKNVYFPLESNPWPSQKFNHYATEYIYLPCRALLAEDRQTTHFCILAQHFLQN